MVSFDFWKFYYEVDDKEIISFVIVELFWNIFDNGFRKWVFDDML